MVLTVGLVGCGRIGFDPAGPLIGFGRSVELGIANTTRDEALADFPLLIALDPTRIDYAAAAADGRDLRFVDEADTVLAHEIERWDPTGRSIVWVRVPKIPAASTGAITMLYGNPEATALPGAATWSGEHAGVYHLNGAVADATAFRLDGTAARAAFAQGPLAEAMELSPSVLPAYAVIPYRAAFDDVVTISGWFRIDVAVQSFVSMIVHPIPDITKDATYLGAESSVLYTEVVDAAFFGF